MYTRIVVPLDGSNLSKRALPLALVIARRSGAAVQLVHTHEPPPRAWGAPAFDTRFDDEERQRMRSELTVLASDLSRKSGLAVAPEFLNGDVARTIATYVAECGASLIVMTTHGRGGISRRWFGSIAETVLSNASCPVLLMRAAARASTLSGEPLFSRVLVPLDDWEGTEAVLPHALAFADKSQTALHLLTVVEPYPVSYAVGQMDASLPGTWGLFSERAREVAADRLARVAAGLRPICDTVITEVAVDPRPATTIVKYADTHAIDLIAVSSHGRGAGGRILFGSVADKVIRSAKSPVLVFRPPSATRA